MSVRGVVQPPFLPMSRPEMERLGWRELDVLLVSGDAYVDHPSFAMALLGRYLVSLGYRVGLVCQPRWDTPQDLLAMGRPRLLAGVGAGALDSMLAHYTAFRKKRHDDAYTPGGKAGARPNRAVIVYTNLVRQAFPGLPVVIGGIEASLRRYVHYDFWSDSLRRPLLLDAKAQVLVYGRGERALGELCQLYAKNSNPSVEELSQIPGIAFMASSPQAAALEPAQDLPSWEEIQGAPPLVVQAALQAERHLQNGEAYCRQRVGERVLVVTPPPPTLESAAMDGLYRLPFKRRAHPSYGQPIPALEMIRWSITSHRGCGGGCSFCSLALHQGRPIASRSARSIAAELELIVSDPQFKGSISDVGGPTANMWQAKCSADPQKCKRASCMFPSVCPHFKDAQTEYVKLLDRLSAHPKVKHVRIASGVRFDLALRNLQACQAFVGRYTGGQMKIAPEHSQPGVLRLMRKPSIQLMDRFLGYFYDYSRRVGKEQYVVPYLMSAFPGCTLEDMRSLARWLRQRGWSPQQVQCFIPTPGTVATAMYYAQVDTQGKPLYVARSDRERMEQHYLLFPNPKQKDSRKAKPTSSPSRRKRR